METISCVQPGHRLRCRVFPRLTRSASACGLVLLVALTGCSPVGHEDERPQTATEAAQLQPSWTEMIGKPFSTPRTAVPPGITTLYVIDVSVLVGKEPTYNDSQFGWTTWTVIAVCADGADWLRSTSVEIAVIPTESFTPDVAKRLADGEFNGIIACEGRPIHG